MAQVLHGSARTTQETRRAIQESKESLKTLSERYGVNIKTVAKWRKRDTVEDAAMGPKNPRSTVLTVEEEAMIVAFRKHTWLGLNDCLYALQETIPHLSRSSLYRCLQRHGVDRLPQAEPEENAAPAKKKFEDYPIGYFHVDISDVYTEEGKLRLIVAVDRTCKYVYAELADKADKMTVALFLERLIETLPYRIHTILTDNGAQFTNRSESASALVTPFDLACRRYGIEHRLTKVNHPWTNGQVERMNRTLKEATVKKYHYGSHDELRKHLALFLLAYNFGKRLKALKGQTPNERICSEFDQTPNSFKCNPCHHTAGPYT